MIRIGDTVYLDGMEPINAPLPAHWPRAPMHIVAPLDSLVDMRPGGIIRVKRAESVTAVPNRLHGAAINAEGDAI